MDKEELIISLLRDTREDQKTATEDIAEIKLDVALNAKDLQEHMTQTMLVKQIALDNKSYFDKRIELIEKKLSAPYLLKLIVTVASGIGIVSGAIYGVARLLHGGI